MRSFRKAWLRTVVVMLAVLFLTEHPGPVAADVRPHDASSMEPVSFRVDSPDPDVLDDLTRSLKIFVMRGSPRYDSMTGQARWPYWIKLKNTSKKYSVHLTLLKRQVRNGMDVRLAAEGAAGSTWQEFKLDMRRADLHLERKKRSPDSGVGTSPTPALGARPHELWFPCAEQLGQPGFATIRNWQGRYSVWRVYSGDVTRDESDDGQPLKAYFRPVEISFWLDFELSEIQSWFPTAAERDASPRLAEWGVVSNVCESCRALIMCEAIRRTGPFRELEIPVFTKNDAKARVHVIVGLERRSVFAEPSTAEQQRTTFCTEWALPGEPIRRGEPTDGTEEGLAAATPYLTFHHSMLVSELPAGVWKVTARTSEAPETACTNPVWSGEFRIVDAAQ